MARQSSPTKAQLQEQVAAREGMLDLLTERLAELELALDEQDWTRISYGQDREFSREGLRRIIALSRLNYLKNPLINRAVNVQAMYVWAQGIDIQAADDDVNALVQAFLDDPANQVELTSHQARTLKEIDLQVLGNVFLVLFTNRATGQVRVRSISVDEVAEIITNPEDAKEPWYYKRVWTESRFDTAAGTVQGVTRTAYHPDWRYSPPNRPVTIGADPVRWDAPAYHLRVGGLSDMRFGVPETYQALDWARAYKEFLEDWATIVRAYARFAFQLTTKGGAKGVAAAKAKLGTTLGSSATGARETNPPPTAGSMFLAAEGNSLTPIRTSGATTSAEDGRHMKLMVAAAMGLPETFFGDVSTGNLATARSLDRPTELKFLDRRTFWRDVLQALIQYLIDQAIRAGKLAADVDRHVDASFPELLERDMDARISSIVKAATLDGKSAAGTLDDRTLVRLLLSALGVDQVDELVDAIAPEGGESLLARLRQEKSAQAREIARRTRGQEPDEEMGPGDEAQAEAFVEALRELREAVRSLGS